MFGENCKYSENMGTLRRMSECDVTTWKWMTKYGKKKKKKNAWYVLTYRETFLAAWWERALFLWIKVN